MGLRVRTAGDQKRDRNENVSGGNLEINVKRGGNNRAQLRVCLNPTVGEKRDSYTILTPIKTKKEKAEQATSDPARLHPELLYRA